MRSEATPFLGAAGPPEAFLRDGAPGAKEHIWGYVHHHADGVFNVSHANTPYTQTAPIETRRDVPESDVEDWQIMTSDGRIKGGFSLRALFEYVERNGIHLNRTMRTQRAQSLDAAEQGGAREERRVTRQSGARR